MVHADRAGARYGITGAISCFYGPFNASNLAHANGDRPVCADLSDMTHLLQSVLRGHGLGSCFVEFIATPALHCSIYWRTVLFAAPLTGCSKGLVEAYNTYLQPCHIKGEMQAAFWVYHR